MFETVPSDSGASGWFLLSVSVAEKRAGEKQTSPTGPKLGQFVHLPVFGLLAFSAFLAVE